MKEKHFEKLSKRERQILDIILSRKEASVEDVLAEIPNQPSYSTVRALMRIMEEKGYLKHKKSGLKYLYYSAFNPKKVIEDELKRLLKTHFNNSMNDAVAALINIDKKNLSEDDFKKLHNLIDKAKSQGK